LHIARCLIYSPVVLSISQRFDFSVFKVSDGSMISSRCRSREQLDLGGSTGCALKFRG